MILVYFWSPLKPECLLLFGFLNRVLTSGLVNISCTVGTKTQGLYFTVVMCVGSHYVCKLILPMICALGSFLFLQFMGAPGKYVVCVSDTVFSVQHVTCCLKICLTAPNRQQFFLVGDLIPNPAHLCDCWAVCFRCSPYICCCCRCIMGGMYIIVVTFCCCGIINIDAGWAIGIIVTLWHHLA